MNGAKYYMMGTLATAALLASCSSSSTPNSGNSSVSNGADNTVREAQYVGTNLYIAGDFDSVGGKFISGVGMWDGAKWSNPGSALPVFVPGSVDALTTDGANLYVGGSFVGGLNNSELSAVAEWTGSTWQHVPSPNYNLLSGEWTSKLAYGGGSLYAFDGINTFWKYDGSAWTNVSNGLPVLDSMTSMVTLNGALLAVFTSISFSHPRTSLWKYDGQWTEEPQAFSYTSTTGPEIQLVSSGNNVYGAGDFSAVGSTQLTSYGIAKWDGTNWSSVGTLSGTNKVTAVAVDPSGNVYIGEPNALMEYNGTNWSTVATTSGGFGNEGIIRTIAVTANHLAIGGDFTAVNGAAANHISILR